MAPFINLERLWHDLEALAKIGRDPRGGISRPSFSRADLEARTWLKENIKAAGLELREDGAGNIFGRLQGQAKGPVILAGSHLDTVINGGKYDGSVGVLSALECLRTIKEANIVLSKPIEIVSFTDEEGNLVGDFLGSRAFTGFLKKEELARGQTHLGQPLNEILEGTGLTIESIARAHTTAPQVEAFLELHIEQGETLELEEVPLGLVNRITGKRLFWCSFFGRPGHAGTTPMELRQDSFLGLAEFALHSTRLVAGHEDGRLTIGRVSLHPGTFSIIPGQADFTLDLRFLEKETLHAMEKRVLAVAEEVAQKRGLSFRSRLVDATEPTDMSPRLLSLLQEEAQALGYRWMHLSSGAGHDAQIVAGVAETALIFIPCLDGISHSPEEAIRKEDLEKGANLLLRALLRLAS